MNFCVPLSVSFKTFICVGNRGLMVLMVTVVLEGVLMVVMMASGGVVGGGRDGSIICNLCIALDGCINFFFACVQYLPVGGDFSEGGVGVECGGISFCGSLFS